MINNFLAMAQQVLDLLGCVAFFQFPAGSIPEAWSRRPGGERGIWAGRNLREEGVLEEEDASLLDGRPPAFQGLILTRETRLSEDRRYLFSTLSMVLRKSCRW